MATEGRLEPLRLLAWLGFSLLLLAAARAGPLEDGRKGDRGDDTYGNPILPGDFQNTDVVRVRDDYYYISATKALSPGMLVLHSRDLVNWQPIGHVVPDITVFSRRFNYDRMEGEMRGIWAGAIAWRAGRFYVYFTTPDEGIYVSTATDPAGPWEPLTCLLPASGWDDPCPFWDDDGQAYLVATHFALNPKTGKTYETHLFKMSPDGKTLLLDSDLIIHQSPGAEASKLFKVGAVYYRFYSEVTNEGRVPMIQRAKTLTGPYETRQLLHVNRGTDREPNQGTLLQTAGGDWVFITHHGLNEWEGRPASLLPVRWVDGWPVAGAVGPDGIGQMAWSGRKPVGGVPETAWAGSDDFTTPRLAPQWEWFFQPRADKWSLTQRPGWLRLHACKPLAAGDLRKTGNILTQRPLRVAANTATVRLDISRMADGQSAGLCFLGKTSGSIAVLQHGDERKMVSDDNGKRTAGNALPAAARDVWLCARWGVDGVATFGYSLDGHEFSPLGGTFQITSFGSHLGAKIGIFTVNERQEAGWVDVDSFQYVHSLGAAAGDKP